MTLQLPVQIYDKDMLIVWLSAAVLFLLFVIIYLLRKLRHERYRHIVPILALEIDQNEGAIFLKNESPCFAKNITIQDITLNLGYEFKKILTLKTKPIELLHPNKRIELDMDVLDGEHAFADMKPEYFLAHLTDASFDMILSYTNMVNVPFVLTLKKQKASLTIKELSSPKTLPRK